MRNLFPLCVVMLAAAPLWAASPPPLINYQGFLKDASGAVPTGDFEMQFRFYDLDSGGLLLLTDTHDAAAPSGRVAVIDGLFTARLGAGTLTGGAEPDFASIFRHHDTVWLEIQIAPDTVPLTPRIRVISSAYAQNSASLDGLDSSAFTQKGQAETIGGDWTFTRSSGYSGGIRMGTPEHYSLWSEEGEIYSGTAGETVASMRNGDGSTAWVAGANDAAIQAYLADFPLSPSLYVATPTQPGHAATKEYADTHGPAESDPSALLKEGEIVWNGSHADVHARFASAWDDDLLYLDGTAAGRIGIGTASPNSRFDAFDSMWDPSAESHVGNFHMSVSSPTIGSDADLSAIRATTEFWGDARIRQGSGISSNLNWNNTNLYGQGVAVLAHWSTGMGTAANADFLAGVRTSLDHNSSGAIDRVYGYYCNQVDVGGGGTINNVYGFAAGVLTGPGKTNVWSFYAEDPLAPSAFMGPVGIGTLTPAYKLDVSGDARITGSVRDASGDAGTARQVLSSTGTGIAWSDLPSETDPQVEALQTGKWCISPDGATVSCTQDAPSDADWIVSGSDMYSGVPGNVGIGTAIPVNKLDVEGGAAIGATYAGTSAAPADGLIVEGNVGIGITTPSYRLQLSADSAAKPFTNTWATASDARLKKDVTPFTDGLGVLEKINPVRYRYNGLAGLPKDQEGIGVIAQEIQRAAPYTVGTFKAKLDERAASDTELLDFNSHALTFVLINAVKELDARTKGLADEGAEVPDARTPEDGPGGTEGTATPQALDTDVREAFRPGGPAAVLEVSPDVKAGEVVVIVPSNGVALHPCYAPSDPMVVGIALAAAVDGLAPVTASGFALVKADATLAPIAKGDLLTTSANPGHAMKAPKPAEQGTVIGKALETLETGTDLIKVLVMLR